MTAQPFAGRFQVGGSLKGDNALYVERAADRELHGRLRAGQTCFVFNSRQMGKSSLRVRTMERLRSEGVLCVVIDPQSRGTSPTEEQWYAGTIKRLLQDLDLAEQVPFSAWWKDSDVQELSPVNRFEEFIDTILLARIQEPIVIFVEEVDNLLSLNFDTDGFFSMVRSLLERRAEHPAYQRLNFCFLGVATPYDLIRGDHRSAFNIGHAVELAGFSLAEAQPLLAGLRGVVVDPEGVLAAVIRWSGGQPFLTQKLLALVCAAPANQAGTPPGDLVESLVRERIIHNWEGQDSPVHLRTIRDRLLQGDERERGRLLGLVQAIQERDGIPANASHEQMQLRLTGLVAPDQGQLRIINPIYAEVFSRDWVRDTLAELRPPIYAAAIHAWEAAPPSQRSSHLIGGAALVEALAWAKGKSLSAGDQEFLEVSRAAEETLRLAEERGRAAERDARRRRKVIVAMGLAMVALAGVSTYAWHEKRVAQWREQVAEVLGEAGNMPVEAMIRAIALHKRSSGSEWANLTLQETTPLALAMAELMGWGEVDRLVGHKGAVMAAAYSPDGQRIVSGSADHTLRLWSAANGQAIGAPFQGHRGRVRSVAFSPDGRRIVSGSDDKTVRLWDATTGQPIGAPLAGHGEAVLAVAFSPDGRRIATGSADRSLRLWDGTSGRPIGPPLRDQWTAVRALSFSPDGRLIVIGSADGTLRLLDASTGKPLGPRLVGHTQDVRTVAFRPDGRQIVSGSTDRTLRLWEVPTGRPVGRPLVGHPDAIRAAVFSRDGRRIVSGSADNSLRIWDASSGQAIDNVLRGHTGAINAVAISPDGRQILSGAADHTLRLWDTPVGQTPGPSPVEPGTVVKTLDFSPDGRLVVTGMSDHGLRIWDHATGRPVGKFSHGHTQAVVAAAFSPEGRRIVTGSRDHTLRRWDVTSRRPIGPPMVGHTAPVRSVTFSPDGRRIVSGSEDTTLRIWDATTGLPIGQPLRGHSDWVKVVRFSRNGRILVSGSSDTTLRLWDGATGRPIAPPLTGHDDTVNTLAVSPDGRRIVSGSGDGSLILWDPRTAKAVGPPLLGHASAVRVVAFSRQGRRIHSAAADNTLRSWDAETHQPIRVVPILQKEVTAMAFTPDASELFTVVGDQSLHSWKDTPHSTLRLACYRLRRHNLLLRPEAFKLDKEFEATTLEARQVCRDDVPPHQPEL
ncbi:MAG: AAA-like domain-containing protein [Cyanobacteriota bacterium]|nr:AAA-like domain-containing protein [Cyanobacteriota bacterium]